LEIGAANLENGYKEKNGVIDGLENMGRELREELQEKNGEIDGLGNSCRELREYLQALKRANREIREGMQEKDEEIKLLLQASSYNRMQIGALKTTATQELAQSKRTKEKKREMKNKLSLGDIIRGVQQRNISKKLQDILKLTENESLLTKQLSNAIEKIEEMRRSASMLEDNSRPRKRAQNETYFMRGWYGEEM